MTDGYNEGQRTHMNPLPYVDGNIHAVEQELYSILTDYSNDLAALKKRNGLRPAEAAIGRITAHTNQAIKQALIELKEQLEPEMGPTAFGSDTESEYNTGFRNAWNTYRYKIIELIDSKLEEL